jgi:general secretion pathway protein K
MRIERAQRQSGGALLAVLWLAAALGTIAFSIASTVRTETERTSTLIDGVRAKYLASGSIDRAMLWIFWGLYYNYRNEDGSPRYYSPPMPFIRYQYASGEAIVEVAPESGKLNVNKATPDELIRLLAALGVDTALAGRITAGIIQWRESGPPGVFSPGGSSFQPGGASMEELEDILLVPGMTPDIFYGRYDHDPSGRLIPRGGLRDCLTVWGNSSAVDVNTAPPQLLESLGIPPQAVQAIVARRQQSPFKSMDEVRPFLADAGPGASRLRIGGNTIWTLRATARVRTPNGQYSDLRRTVAAVVKFLDPRVFRPAYHVLRWYDDAWSPVAAPGF